MRSCFVPLCLLLACSPGGTKRPSGSSASSVPSARARPNASASASAAANGGLPVCFGSTTELAIHGGRPFVKVLVGKKRAVLEGLFVLDFASTVSAIDGTAWTPNATPELGCADDQCKPETFFFMRRWSEPSFASKDLSELVGGVRRSGVIATDFLSQGIYTIDYGEKRLYEALPESWCGEAVLEKEGFTPLDVTGHFSNDLTKLLPFSTVAEADEDAGSVANVPAVELRFGAVPLRVVVRTTLPPANQEPVLELNVPARRALEAAKVRLVPLDEPGAPPEFIATCVDGVRERIQWYRFPAVSKLRFKSGNAEIPVEPSPLVVVRTPAPNAARCGGPTYWRVPAGYIAAGALVDLRRVALDPFAGRLWLQRRPARDATAAPGR